MGKSLGYELPREMARVRTHVLPHYVDLGAVGMFAATMIRADLDAAADAIMASDFPEMLRLYQVLKDTHA